MFDWIPRVQAAYRDVLEEFVAVNEREGISSFVIPEYDGAVSLHQWKTFHLIDQKGGLVHANVAKAPKTWALLSSIPRISLHTMAMFSVVMPGGSVKAHTGYSNMFLRIHFTLVNKHPDLCTIEVDGDRFGWKEGEIMVFDDSFWHSFRNDGPTPRVVLFFDIWHPSISDDEFVVVNEAYSAFNTQPSRVHAQESIQQIELLSPKAIIKNVT